MRMRLAVRAANVGLWDWDLRTNQVYFSPEWKRQIGCEGHETADALGEWESLVHPEDLPGVKKLLTDYLANPRLNFMAEFRLRHKHGSWRWILAQADLVKDGQGTPVRMVGSHVDITERKHLETERDSATEGLRHSEANLQLALAGGRLGEWHWDITTGEVTWSPFCKALYGLSPSEEISYERFLAAVHPDDRARIEAALKRALATQADYEEEKRVIWPDGSTHWNITRGRVFCDAAGKALCMAGVTMDITERRLAEQERLAHLRFFENLDKVNRAIQGAENLEQMMSDVLDTLLEIFQCDRAWLVYPCDPDATSWRVPMERTRPEYPGALALGIEVPMDPETANVARTLRDSNRPVKFGPESEHSVPTGVAQGFSVQSFVAMALHPKVGKPYMFGLHQCSHARIWTPDEERLFQEVGRRVADSLTSLRSHLHVQESEQRHRLALQAGRIGAFEWELQNGQSTWTPELAEIWGMPDGFTGEFSTFCLEHVHPEDQAWVKEHFAQMAQSGEDGEMEFRLIRPDGATRWIRWRSQVIQDAVRGCSRLVGVNLDITQRKQAEVALRASMARVERQEAALIALSRKEALPDGDLLTSLRRITETSARALGVARVGVWRFNEDRSAICCVDLYELQEDRHSAGRELAVADYPTYFQSLAECDVIAAADAHQELRTCEFSTSYLKPLGITSMMDAPILLKGVFEGVVCHEHVGPKRQWASDERTFAIAISNAVSLALEEGERKQAEKALRQSQRAYAALVNTIDGIVWEADAETFRFLFVSQMAERLLGYPIEQWLAGPNFWRDHLHPDDRDWAVNFCVESTRCKQDHDFSYRMIAADGRVVWLHDWVSVVIHADRPTILRGIMVDITESKRGEEELKLFRTLMDRSNDSVEVIDPATGRFLDVNEKACQVHGYSREEYLARSVPDLETLLDLTTEERWRKQAEDIRAKGFMIVEGEHRRKDGSTFPVEINVNYIHLDREYLVAVVRDITDRKRAEAALRESQARLELANRATRIGPWDWDLRTNEVVFSKEWKRQLGYEEHEITGRYDEWESRLHPEDRDRVLALLHAYHAGESPDYELEFRMRHKDGSYRWIFTRGEVFRNAEGKPYRMFGCHLDITERKHAVLALHESRQLMEQAQQVGHIGSWVSDLSPAGKLTWSAETCRIFGLAPGEFDGEVKTFYDLVHVEDREAVAKASRAARTGERPYDLEHRILRRDGGVRWVHEQAEVQRDPAGRPVCMVGVVQDITERKQLERQLRESQKMDAVGQLAGGIAHDFNNLLVAIIGNAELLKLMTLDDPGMPESVEAILKASSRARDLVKQILAFSRRHEQKRQPIQLHSVVREALKLLRATVPATIEFKSNLAIAPTVLADATQIHQVTMNLCTNAWHAMRDRPGVLKIELHETEVAEVFARLNPDLRPGRYVRLTVADTGCGMDPATLSRIFEPFFTTKPQGEGTGLGLAVVHGIIKNHDGGIVVESQPGQGTAFHLYFPVFEAEVIEADDELEPVPRGQGEHILFVDDEEPLVELGRKALVRFGYRVTALTSPGEALAVFQAQPADFDLVITDFNMPAINGAVLGAKLLAIRPDVRLILTTGYSATVTPDSARVAGFREFLPKPYDLRNLGEAAHRVLDESPAAKG